ncbi:MAG TPA: DUF3662 and FHA domain-containing protein [Actinomycetota bacterium]|nr:DUF3662 and FHA domain-containing protein [Actinomycetota bacterium]
MSVLREFERRLGGLVEGVFAKAFRSGLQPVELAKRILREMDAGRTLGVREVWAPNRFAFRISARDAERIGQMEAALRRELEQVVREAAAERGWGLLGPPEVSFEVDEELGVGEFRCQASIVEGEERVLPGEPAAPTGPAAELVVLEDGRRTRAFRLEADVVTVGRLPACDVVLPDPGVSRRHAEIRRTGDRFEIVDLGSTNGTMVNGRYVRAAELRDGDRVTIGGTILEFRRA